MTEPSLQESYAFCTELARSHYENFPVVSRLVPSDLRGPVAAVYAFARISDDFADEGNLSQVARRALLQNWREQLYRARDGSLLPDDHVCFTALADTMKRHDIPVNLLDDLVKAFEMDTGLVRFPKFEDVLFYCKHSANPIGRLVLWLLGYRDEERFGWSDHICTALQLANFWQDSARDLRRNRIYYPLEDLNLMGVDERQLLYMEFDHRVAELVRKQVNRTKDLFEKGRELCAHVNPLVKMHLRLTWLGGMTILKKIEDDDYNVFSRRPKIRAIDKARLVWHAVSW